MTEIDDMLSRLPRAKIKPSRAKHGNIKRELDGIKFDSAREMRRYQELVLLQRANKISELTLQESFVLVPAVTIDGRKKPSIRYIADFCYLDEDGTPIVEDAKSPHLRQDAVYRIKKHLMKDRYGIEISEV